MTIVVITTIMTILAMMKAVELSIRMNATITIMTKALPVSLWIWLMKLGWKF